MACDISIGLLGLAVSLYSLPAPVHLLVSWIWKTKKVCDFLARKKTISVISILLLLHAKHSSYWEEK